ncbi:MAG: isoprenylcysteine carboxylmethyltransferase family protein [Candidatus Omnitrophica bacterium]|nr:isoprenylcysteine carboxylmethyltransferase family protein [Candidatus Omnitrophota bacterium]
MAKFAFLRFKKLRFYLAWPFAVVLFFVARTNDISFIVGIPIILIGETLRIWAQGCIEKSVRIANFGPYAYMRNPLYLANFLIGLGFVVVLWDPWVFLIYQVGFFILYHGTIRDEEEFLKKEFGLIYQDYYEKVPRFFPSIQPYANRSQTPFRWELVWKHGENITFLTIVLLLITLYLRQEWYQEGNSVYSGQIFLFWVAVAIALVLAVSRIYRRFQKPSKEGK